MMETRKTMQEMLDELHRQQKELTCGDILKSLSDPSIKVSADVGSTNGDKTGVCILPSTAQPEQERLKYMMMENPVVNSYKPVFLPWWGLGLSPNPLKKFPDDGWRSVKTISSGRTATFS